MAQTLRTKLRIGASVLFATGFFTALAGHLLWEPRAQKQPESGDNPAESPWRDLTGALHVHSTYSDGAGDIPTVMAAAEAAGMDFLLLTDHNTQKPRRDNWEARYDGFPLLLIGTEITVEQGAFLLALDMPPEWEPTKHQPPQETIDTVNTLGGLPLISLPFDVKHPWADWEVTGCAGLEVLNLSTIARRHINLLSLLCILPIYYFAGSLAALRALVTRPDAALARWDHLLAGGGPVIGIGALDAHALMKIGRKKYPIPSYEDSFRAATTHVLVRNLQGELLRREIYDALRAGRCYFGYDCLADPTGFVFVARSGEKTAEMGEAVARNPDGVLLSATAPKNQGNVLLRLIHNGQVVAAGRNLLRYRAHLPGAYRIEAYREKYRIGFLHIGIRPWIFTNPIYVRSV